ncbi:site-specific DNA-methyltransferase [Staphylococcus pseudintermedius]|nr:site-specific DNA-methyltransferase [Staphylococcus pseudintermedius]
MRDLFLNKVTNIDCVEGMERLPDNSIDLIVTSPPYDNLRDYDGYDFDYKRTIKQLYRVTRSGGVIVWVVGDATIKGSETGSSFKQALEFLNAGFKLHDTMIYKKNTSSFPARRDGKRYTQIFEYMFVFSKGKPKKASLICDKPNKWAGHTNWGRNTQRGKDGVLKQTKNIKPVPKHSPRNNIWEYSIGGGVGQKDKLALNIQPLFHFN